MKIDRRVLTGGFPLLALFAIGGCSSGSYSAPPPPPPPPPDTTAPTVSAVQAPAGTVDRIVTLTLTASDNIGVTEVRFFVDGQLLGTVAAPPYSIDWDTSTATEGDHVLSAEATDAAGNVAQSAGVSVTVRNIIQFAIALSGEQEVPPTDSQASGQASVTVNLVTGEVQGELTTNGLTATAAHIHDAFAGTNGSVLVPLDQDAGDPSRFTVPAGATFDAAGLDRLLAGALYVNTHSDAAPGGEIRGQILPNGFVLRFTDIAGTAAVPQVHSLASGRAAVTLDQANGTLVVQVQVEGLDDATQAHVHEAYAGARGPVLVPLAKDATNSARWFVEDGELNTAGLDAFAAGRLYVNVHSPANPGGEIRGQVLPDGIKVIFTELSGEQRVPVVDTRAEGLAALTLDEAGALMTLHVNTRRLAAPTNAHLHGAFAGANGGVEVGLTQDGGDPDHWFVEEAALSTAQLDALLAGATYVNVHSTAHSSGEIRGQVIPDGIVFAFGQLSGSQRVPVVNTAATGTFAVTANPVAGTLVAHANTSGVVNPTVAHIHDGYAGTNGGVAVPLVLDPGDDSHWSAIDAPVDTNQLAALRSGRYYINVHTQSNPGGEIRGQLAPSPVEVRFTNLSGTEEVPAVATAASGIAATTIDRETGTVTLHLNASGADDATASHIHGAYAGQTGGVRIGLQRDAGELGHWFVSGAQLDDTSLADYLAGALYVNLHTPANPSGEIRGQIVPPPVEVLFTTLSGDEEVPPVMSAASGIAATTVNRDTGVVTLHLNSSGAVNPTGSHIHTGSVGQNGPVLIPLEQDLADLDHWSVTNARLDATELADYRAGQLYVNLHTMANTGGEIRGQIVPPDAADFDSQAPTVTLTAPASPVSGSVALAADATDDQGVAEVRFLANGVLIDSDASAPYSVDWDTTMVADGEVTLTAEAEDFAGNVGVSGDVVVTVQNGSPVTLSQIQAQVFTPLCAGCHSGPTSGNLPSGMNLSSAANSHAALFNVASLQVPTTDRVEPGDPDNSYLIQKLGENPPSGSRMPQGGPFLDQATIDMIRQWITEGALNN